MLMKALRLVIKLHDTRVYYSDTQQMYDKMCVTSAEMMWGVGTTWAHAVNAV